MVTKKRLAHQKRRRLVHAWECPTCRPHPNGRVGREHRALNRLLAATDERTRRLLAGFLARQHGRGGIALLARITGLDRNTIARGRRELRQPGRSSGRIRRPGGGRPHVEKKSPRVRNALEELLQDTVAGDPVSGLKWTHRSLRKLQKALRRRGLRLALATIARRLRRLGFSLQTCRKQRAGLQDPDRDRPFRYLAWMRKLYLSKGLPVISVDTKKKEWVGNFKNPGRCWRKHHRPVLDHDYPSWALGQAIPVGIYDVGPNDGYVVVGTSHETAAFIAAAIGQWWRAVGRRRYARARRRLLQMDGGGANDPRQWLGKVALQPLADETGLIIVVTHYPAGASKGNRIEHRMFSPISGHWAGEPLDSYETIGKYIRTTRTEKGFRCRARLDRKDDPVRQRVAPEDKARVRRKPHRVLPKWNYTIWPHHPHSNR
jgi:hypothetical protein